MFKPHVGGRSLLRRFRRLTTVRDREFALPRLFIEATVPTLSSTHSTTLGEPGWYLYRTKSEWECGVPIYHH